MEAVIEENVQNGAQNLNKKVDTPALETKNQKPKLKHVPSLSFSCPSSPSPCSSGPSSPVPPINNEKKYKFIMKDEGSEVKKEEITTVLEDATPVFLNDNQMTLEEATDMPDESWMSSLQTLKTKSPRNSIGNESSQPMPGLEQKRKLSRSISLKEKLAELAKQAEEDDQSYDQYIKDAEKEGKTIIETGMKNEDAPELMTPAAREEEPKATAPSSCPIPSLVRLPS